MGSGIDNITNSVRELALARDADNSTHSQLSLLQNAVQELDQSTKTVTSQALSTKAFFDDINSSDNTLIEEVCSLHKQTKKLTEIALDLKTTIDGLAESTESSIFRHLTSLGSRSAAGVSRRFPRLTSHFESRIKDIVREVLKSTSDRDILWKAAEACYEQAVTPDGTLHASSYFDTLAKGSPGCSYRPGLDSERHAADSQEQLDQSLESREKRQGWIECWIEFWVGALNKAPNGPTLFYPPSSPHSDFLALNLPRYLFRTFDVNSSGRNNRSVIASIASLHGPKESNRVDILSREQREATQMLYMHLNKPCFGGGKKEDNLMSWTSSLLFAVQYAVWRAHYGNRRAEEISICAVDTSKFPLGQFARDSSLIETNREAAAQLGESTSKFFKFRLTSSDYYNGEYLSQGVVNHAGRSCIMSLEQLIQAGLFRLYPEFEDAEGRKKWAKRVRDLRQIWSVERETAEREILLALKVSRDCFAQLSRVDIASILLSFKHRKYSNQIATSVQSNPRHPEWAGKPMEVYRYWITSEVIKSLGDLPEMKCRNALQRDQWVLRRIFS